MNVLVIAPHPDDEAIGCGGSICLHARAGDRVAVVFLTSGEMALKHLPRDEAWAIREAEARAAGEVMGVASAHFLHLPDWYTGDVTQEVTDALSAVLADERPELVYVTHPEEWHPDHRAAPQALAGAVRAAQLRVPEIRTYEVWSPLAQHEHVQDITGVMRQKLQAVRRYRSQLAGFRYDRAVRGLNAYRGVLAGRCRFAEVFGTFDLSAATSPAEGGERHG